MNVERAISVIDAIDRLRGDDGIGDIHLYYNGRKQIWIRSDKLWKQLIGGRTEIFGNVETYNTGSVTLSRTREEE